MKTLYVLLDGAEDHCIPECNGKKPLDVAHMPFFRSVCKERGHTTGREYTHLFLNEFFAGVPPSSSRAAIEALGLGMRMDGRTAYRMSPARIKDGRIEWIYDLDEIGEVIKKAAYDNMHILEGMDPETEFFLSGRAIITMVCDDIPDLPAPPNTADFVEVPGPLGEFVMSIADELGGITLYPWGCGRASVTGPPFIRRMTAVSNTPTALGISRSLGYDIRYVRDIDERFRTARDELERNDVFLHLDEIDEYSHQKDPPKKVRILEHMDRMFSKHFSKDDRIVFFIDHGTSSVTGEHILMDVPFWTSFHCGIDMKHIPLHMVVPSIAGIDGKR
jgi:2,3-bisphosphoglycerate-independent phosphoglycerate mutase